MKYIIAILLILCGFYLKSQNLSKAFDYVKAKEFIKAEEIFKEAVSNSKDIVVAKYGLAIIYADKTYEKFSLVKAYKNINYTSKKIEKSDENKEILKKYNINTSEVLNLQENICRQAYNQIEHKDSAEFLTQYLQIYTNSKFSDRITKKRDSIEFAYAKKNDDFREYQSFFLARPQSEYAEQAKALFKKSWTALYLQAAMYGETEQILQFEQLYPDYPFYDESSKLNKDIAAQATELNLAKNYEPADSNIYINFIKIAAPRETAYLALMKIIESNIRQKKYENAIQTINRFLPYFTEKNTRLKELINILKAPNLNITSENFSNNINTNAWEYSAAETADGKKLYFCGRNRPDNLLPDNEDIFVSYNTTGIWSKPVPVSAVNTTSHEAPLSVTADGNRLLLYSNSDIFYTDKIKGGWSQKTKFPQINTPDSWEADAMITADGNAILFISDRKNNIGSHIPFGNKFHASNNGNTDIYVSVKKGDIWTNPVNIGSTVNTPFAERSPFLHFDMKTLYFSSDGHGGLGKFDVYMTKRLSDTSWTQWSKPVNLGKEINSTNDEMGYKISTSGDMAFYSGFQNNNFDIFRVKLPESMRPETVTVVSGKITDSNSNSLHAVIKWENLETGNQIGYSTSDPEDGTFVIILPNGKNYGYFIEKQQYYPASGNIDLTKFSNNNEHTKNIKMFSVEEILAKNIAVPLPNLFFESNKYSIKKESYPELQRLADFIKLHSDVKFEISGHTDNVGTMEHNMKLSQDRAEEVKKYLISKGCDPKNLVSAGYGPTKPVATNQTDAGKSENRRVEFKIIK